MKKIFVILILVAGIFFLLHKRGENAVLETLPPGDLIVFSQAGCSHCHNAQAFIKNTIRPKYPKLKIQILDVKKQENLTKLIALAKRYRIDENNLSTPVILINGQVLVGWKSEYEKRLLDAIRKLTAKKS